MARRHPVRFLAHKKSNGRHAGRNYAPLAGWDRVSSKIASFHRGGRIQGSWMWRQPSPSYRPGQAQLVKPLGIVIGHPPRQNLPLPGIRRNLESLQLVQDFQRAALSYDLSSISDVLPSHEPAHELRCRYRLNLLAQRANSKTVNAGQQPPLAPFSLRNKCGNSRPRLFSRAQLDKLVWRGPALI